MKKVIVFVILIIIIVIGYNYIYQDHRNVTEEQASYSISALKISEEFFNNPVTSEKKYLNKTITISGLVTAIHKNNLTLNTKVFCMLTKTQFSKINSKIKVKGRFIGYDDLLEEIKLDQCHIIKQD